MNKTIRFPLFFLLSMLLLAACKEKNDIYPPLPWRSYFFGNEKADARPVSAMLIENDHAEWYGSLDQQGILYNNGYDWLSFTGASQGLILDSVTCLLSDGYGTLWAGCRNGLARFDGNQWETIENFRGKRVTSLALQGAGILWVGMEGDAEHGGLATNRQGDWDFFNPETGGVSSSMVTSLHFDQQQGLWIGTADMGIFRLSGDSWDFFGFDDLRIAPARINCMISGNGDETWMGTSASLLLKFDGISFIPMNSGSLHPITSLHNDKDGALWAGTLGGGLLKLENNKWIAFTRENLRLPSDSVLTLAPHPEGGFLVSYADGHIIKF